MTVDVECIDHIHIHVRDRRKTELWYAQVLGFTRIEKYAFWAVDGGPLTLQNKAETVHLALFENPDIQRTTVAFGVGSAGLLAWITHLSANGIDVQPVDHQLAWSIYFKDPDGNPFEITTYEYDAFLKLVNAND